MSKTERTATVERTTRETAIKLTLSRDGTGESDLRTPVGFLDHMLELFSRHGRFDLTVEAVGDVDVDAHHTVEDVGIVLGQAFAKALGDKRGIARFADVRVPMQDSLAAVAVDISGRPELVYNAVYPTQKIGEFDVELVEEFFQALCTNALLTLHVDIVRGGNSHHIAESIFKATARALRAAVRIDPSAAGEVPSTKGKL